MAAWSGARLPPAGAEAQEAQSSLGLVPLWQRRLGAFACASIVLVAGSRAAARRFLFPTPDVPALPEPTDVVTHELTARDGVRVRALELITENAPVPVLPEAAPVVVHFHNNRDSAEGSVELVRELRARGLGALIVEYRGYGHSREAPPTEDGLYADAESALDMLSARGVGPDRVVLWGTSLGTGVAAEMARRGRGSRLVLVTPYTSIPDLVTDRVPFVPARALLPDTFDTLAKAPGIDVPTLVIHGDDDEIVPFPMGERVARAIPRARLLRIAGGHHGDLFARARARIFDAIAELARATTTGADHR